MYMFKQPQAGYTMGLLRKEGIISTNTPKAQDLSVGMTLAHHYLSVGNFFSPISID